jgi:hypothetical protein
MLTPSELIQRFETGDTPTGEDFAELITSLRSKLEAIPAAQISGLAALIAAAVTAELNSRTSVVLNVTRDQGGVNLQNGETPIGRIETANESEPGLLQPDLFTKVRDLPADAEKNQTIEEIATGLAAFEGLRIPASAVEGIEARPAVSLTVESGRTYEVPADTVLKTFYMTPLANGPIRIGITPGGGEIVDEEGVQDVPISYGLNGLFEDRTTLYLSGNFRIKFKTESYA